MRKLRGLLSSAVAVAVIAGAAPVGAEGAAPPGGGRAGLEDTATTPEQRHIRRLLYDLQNDGDPTTETVELGVEIFYGPSSNPSSLITAMQQVPEGRGATVDDLFADLLRRPADPASRQFFMSRLDRVGRIKVAADLVASNEYYATEGFSTNSHWVNAMYRDLLGRPPDSEGRQYFVDELARGRTRGSIASAVSGGVDGRSWLVYGLMTELLRTRYDRGGIRYYAGRLAAGWTVERLITHFATRPEYVTRARAELGDEPIIVLGDGSELIRTTTQGGAVTRLDVTGLAVGEQVLGIEWTHAQSPLLGITSLGRLISIAADGAATSIGLPVPGLGADGRPVGLGVVAFGFSPSEVEVVDGDTGYRLNRTTGAVIETYAFAYDEGDLYEGTTPDVRGFGYHTAAAGELGMNTDRGYLDEATGAVVETYGEGILASDVNEYQVGREPLHMDGLAVFGFDRSPATRAGYALLEPAGGELGLYALHGGEPRLIATLTEDEVLGLAVVGSA